MIDLSIIIPVFNEEKFIAKCLDSIIQQDFGDMKVEFLLSDGGSTDSTKKIINKYILQDSRVKVFDNKKKFQVYALNQLVREAAGEYIIRCDAHALYENGYFISLVNYLKNNTDVGNVGSKVETVTASSDEIPQLIAIALGSKYGVGSSHRNLTSNEPIEVDTVLFGAWRSSLFKEVGDFDETFVRGQDLEHNIRIVKSGLKVVQINGPKVTYFARDKVSKLFNMMKQYASVKPFIFMKHGIFPTLRSLIPFSFYLSLIFLCLISPVSAFGLICVYLLYLFSGAYKEIQNRNTFSKFSFFKLGTLFIVQHIGHAYGMLIGGLSSFRGKNIKWRETR
ncbi:hypothetical protein AUR67_03840 [Pseudoalteromonas sp. XI10]|uniref:glycosyltransferase family 2 protein n=1 Tax=Pseudoalteromonas sp. XI10 TaxID=1766621 RepID=UPI0007333ED5|nr:glycosyltransferase family 2 protein [Pseudoalteromonas sp. XI10]KTG22202.1 hypothetical protein AUR67_03840 [Pseudoalteromonas sp. XI10]